MTKELDLKDLPEKENYKEFYIGVRYYTGSTPYPILYEKREQVGDSDKIYKIRVPYKDTIELPEPNDGESVIKGG